MAVVEDKFGLVGHEIDQVRFDAVIDQGGFGLVYRGHHLGLDEPVAIKCLNLNRTLDPVLSESFKQRFRDETKIAYRLSKGNLDIVRSISSGTLRSPAGGALIPYMVLEWLKGKSLAIELKERMRDGRGPYTLEDLVSLLDPAVTAIAYAHEQGVVHRDIKPGNLFLTETRDGARVKVLDFGLAKILHPEAIVEPSQETMNGLYICSPSYGAPEQFSPKYGSVGPWSDVYSLALVMLELLSGRKARPAKNLQDAIAKVTDPSIAEPNAAQMGIAITIPLDRVLRRAVAQHAELRPKDAHAFWSEFRDAMLESVVDDFATISNDSLPGRAMMNDALAKAGVKRQGGEASSPGVTSSVASAPASSPTPPVERKVNSKPPPAERTVKLDRDQLKAFAARKDSLPPPATRSDPVPHSAAHSASYVSSASHSGPGRRPNTNPRGVQLTQGEPRAAASAPSSSLTTWLWALAVLALGLSALLLWQALRR